VRGARKLVGESNIHLGSWNIRSLTSKLRELVDTAIRSWNVGTLTHSIFTHIE
jgi:hypothetical protein